MSLVSSFLSRNSERRISVVVVGDTVLDEYFYVDAERVSPEFPIPVMQAKSDKPDLLLPGGAANVCYQFTEFNVDIKLLSLLDRQAKDVISSYGINTDESVMLCGGKVPRKRRFYHDLFPLCRLDIEDENYSLSHKSLDDLQSVLAKNLNKTAPDIIILSDYGKGLFSSKNDATRKWLDRPNNPITIVDPKGGPMSRWRGCSVIKPNEKEAIELSGSKNWQEQCDYFRRETDCTAVVITQGGRGLSGCVGGRYFQYHPNRTVTADCVIGAGDCFVAFLAMGLAHQMDIIDVAEMAFEAGAMYVKGRHNKPITPSQLDIDPLKSKLITVDQLIQRDYRLAFTNGVFDLLHVGHINTLQYAKSKADKLVVAVNSDASTKSQSKSHGLVNTSQDRMRTLASLECVDFIIEFDEETPYNLIKTISPEVLVKGSEYDKPIGSDIVQEVCAAPMIEGFSTTNLIERIKNS